MKVTAPQVANGAAGGTPVRPFSTTEYDKLGQVLKTTDACGISIENEYDGLGRLTTSKVAGVETVKTYDKRGNLLTLSHGGGGATNRNTVHGAAL